MKKFLFLLTGLMFMLASCGGSEDTPNEPAPKPTPTPEETASITMNTTIPSGGLAFDVNGGEKSVSFTTNKDWTVTVAATTGGVTWCTASPTSGSQGNATVKFTVKENTDYDDRSVSVTIKAGTATKTFTINQKGADALLVTTDKYEVAQEGGEIEVEVQANIDYEMEISETAKDWITEATTRALTTHKHTFTIAANEEVEKREGEIIFKSGDKVETVKVYQAGGPVLVLSKNEFNVSDAGEVISIDVKSNIDFGVQLPDVDWIKDEAATRGMSSHTLKYDILPNEAYDAREAEIIFYDKNSDLKETVKIGQAQKDAIIISQKNYEVKAEGETIEVKLSANVDFDVTMPDVDWITQVTTRGLTEHTLLYKVAENTSEDSRSAEIVFTNKDSQLSDTVSIIQEGVFVGSYANGVAIVVKPGSLYSVLPDNSLSLTTLKIIGPINGNDIKYLRRMLRGVEYDERYTRVGRLETLDLSEATIVEGGTYYYYESKHGDYKYYYTSNNCIGYQMFSYCYLKSIILPNNLTEIKYNAFSGSWSGANLISLTINSDIQYIHENAGFESVSSVTIGNNVTKIVSNAFSGFENLKSVNISDLTAWCKIDFENSYANPSTTGAKLYLNSNEVTDLVVPDGITEIKGYAFYNFNALTSVTIPESVTSIGESAFEECSSLKSVTIPNSVTSIGASTFSSCDALTSVTIPESVTSIGASAFNSCYRLAFVTIPESVTSIGANAFRYCSSLQSVTIPNSVTSIEKNTFYECSSLKYVTIGNSVTSIEESAFYYCKALTSITIPNSVTSIGESAFYYCDALSSVYISDLSAWCRIDFENSSSCPRATLYINNNKITDLIIPDDITEIKSFTFSGCSLESVTIPNNVTSIGYSAFAGCSSKSVTIGNSVTSIGESAFASCSLESVTIPNNVTSIGKYAFHRCTSLKSVTILNGVIEVNAFSSCKALRSVTIGNSVTSIGENAFLACTSLYSITIGNSVTSIGKDAFRNCDALNSVYISDLSAWCRIDFVDLSSSPLNVGVNLYLNKKKVTDLVIPDDITEIKKFAFYCCSSLKSVTIGNSVTSIGGSAFFSCDALSSVYITDLSAWCRIDFASDGSNPLNYGAKLYLNNNEVTDLVIPDDITEIKKYAFNSCESLKSVTIGSGVTSIGEEAFYGCKLLTDLYCYAITPPKLKVFDISYKNFSHEKEKSRLYVPVNRASVYATSDWARYFNTILEMEE